MKRRKRITMLFMVVLTINYCYGQVNKPMKNKRILNECWTEIGNSENRMEWFENGNYAFTEPPMESTEWTYGAYPPSKGKGTYIYQSETNEIFVDLTVTVDSLHNGQPIPKFISKKYFKIIEEKGDIVTVQTVYLGFDFDWEIDPTGKRKLIFLCILKELPLKTQTYIRSHHPDKLITNNQEDSPSRTLDVTSAFETIDIEKFNEIRAAGVWCSEHLADSTRVHYRKTEKSSTCIIYPANSYFGYCRHYYPNGNIESKGWVFTNEDFRKGRWYYFNEEGELTKEVNHDEPFEFTFEQMLKFARQEGVIFLKTPEILDDVWRWPSLNRECNSTTGACQWVLIKMKEDDSVEKEYCRAELIKINGVTGDVISREPHQMVTDMMPYWKERKKRRK